MSQAKKNSLSLTKRALAVSVAVMSMSGASLMAQAQEGKLVPLSEDVSSLSINLKYRPAPADKAIQGQYIVVLNDQVVSQEMNVLSNQPGIMSSSMSTSEIREMAVANTVQSMAGAYGADVQLNYHATISGFVARMNTASMKNLMNDNRVAYIEQDQVMSVSATQFNATWGLDRIDQANLPLNDQYTYNFDGTGVTAYILDTGILESHSDFSGRVTSGFTSINDGNGTTDCNGHGTHVAGTVGSDTYGVAKNVSLVPVRVLGCNGSGSNSGVIAGVDWVAQNASGASVANMSLGGGNSSALDNAVVNAINSGVTFVVAAGNSNSNACSGSPNKVPQALTIASSTSSDSRSSFSSWGSCIDMFAPGSSITSTWDNGGVNTISGTSMAAPHVAGVAALYLDQNPSASPAQVEQVLEGAAAQNKISNPNGSPNLLVQSNLGGGPNPTPTPDPTPTPTPPPGGDVLENGVPVSGLSASTGQDVVYTMEVPAGATNINFQISGGSGDADLYTRFGAAPTDGTYDCRPYVSGNNETCAGSQSGGTYYVRVKAYRTFSGVTLVGSYTPAGGGVEPIDETVTGISVGRGQWQRYTLELPSGYSSMAVRISGGSGDADLYVNFGSQSSTSSYDCRPYLNGNNESCTFDNPAAGVWHIDIRGYRASSGVTLNVQAQ